MKRVKINGVSHSMEQKLSTKPAGWERFSWHLMRHKNDSKKQPMALLNHCWKAAKALVFPVYCPCCRQPCDGADNRFLLCNPCKISLLRYRVPSCPRCGLFFNAGSLLQKTLSDVANCPSCQQQKLWFNATLALGPYRGELREAVLRSKRCSEESFTLALGALIGQQLGPLLTTQRIDFVTNTPTHWKRRWQRGVESTELLLRGIVSQVQLPIRLRILGCRRYTRKQGTLTPAERFRNVSNAFCVKKPQQVRGKHVLVVDDVMTSGATVNELARILLQSGACKVTNVVLARGQC